MFNEYLDLLMTMCTDSILMVDIAVSLDSILDRYRQAVLLTVLFCC